MPLHDLHLASLAPQPQALAPAMELALCASFGSAARWRDGFVAMGQAPGGSSGWVMLAFDSLQGRLFNQRVADPVHATAGVVPLLALGGPPDVEALIPNIDWPAVYERYQQAVTRASEGLGTTADELHQARLIDVRRAGVYQLSDAMAEGAQWRDPAQVDAWAAELQAQGPVVVYCVYGHEVSRCTALRLKAAGVDARFLEGGLDGWRAQGREVVARPAGQGPGTTFSGRQAS